MFFRRSLLLLLNVLVVTLFSTINFAAQLPYIKGIYSLPLSLDPIKMNDTASLAVGNLLYDGLLKFSAALKLEGALAESWSTSKNGKTLTFTLKKNIYFHNGEPITAFDAEASLLRTLSSESTVRSLYDSIKSIRATDARTLEIELKFAYPPFLSVLAGSTAKVLPKARLLDSKFFENPIGSGAFKFLNIDRTKKELVLEAFAKYYAGSPKLQKMILKETTEIDAKKQSISGEMHDLSSWPLTALDPIFSNGQKISSPIASTWIIGLNTKKAPFDNLNVRQSFKAQFPTEEFRKQFYPDSVKAIGYVPFGLPGSQWKTELIKNPKASKERIQLVVPEELSRSQEMKTLIEASLSARGWNIEVVLMKWDLLMAGYSKKSHQAFLVSMNMDYPDADFLLKNFDSHNADNFSGLNNPQLDKLIELSRGTQDRKLREVHYKKALQIIESAGVTVNLFHPRANYWLSRCVENFEPNILSEVYIDYSKVSLSSDCANSELSK